MGFPKGPERRKIPRVPVKEGAFAIVRAPGSRFGQILDVSLGGLAFKYIANGDRSNSPFELDILFARFGFFLERLSCKAVSDVELVEAPRLPFFVITTMRCGVQFLDIKDHQLKQLKEFIRHQTNGATPGKLA
jgi:hypothetical protein